MCRELLDRPGLDHDKVHIIAVDVPNRAFDVTGTPAIGRLAGGTRLQASTSAYGHPAGRGTPSPSPRPHKSDRSAAPCCKSQSFTAWMAEVGIKKGVVTYMVELKRVPDRQNCCWIRLAAQPAVPVAPGSSGFAQLTPRSNTPPPPPPPGRPAAALGDGGPSNASGGPSTGQAGTPASGQHDRRLGDQQMCEAMEDMTIDSALR